MKNTQRGFIVPLLIAIIAVLAIGGGIYVYEQSKLQQTAQLPVVADNQVVSTSTAPATTPTTIQITGWKTYTSTKYGLSFSYPATWLLSGANTDSIAIRPKEASDGHLTLSIVSKPIDEAEASIPVFNTSGAHLDSRGSMVLNGREWRKLMFAQNQIILLTNVNGFTYIIQYSTLNSNDPVQEILSSFKFSNPVTTTIQPSITVLSPNGGELLEQNTSYSITWKYTGLSDNDSITIGFRTPNENVCWVGKTTASKRSYSFVPSQVKCSGSIVDLKSGGQFKTQLIVEKYADGRGVADTSDNYFNVAANSSASPIITVLSPNGGEFYKVGSQQIIKWSAPASIQTVRIFLESISTHYAGGGVGGYIPDVHNILAQDATNSGSYAVNIPSVPAGTYKILIEGIDNSGKPTVLSDSSDSYFTITN